MATESLTDGQRRLLQRWFDGELDGDERRRAEQLVEESAEAASYVERLEEVRSAATVAFEEVESTARDRLSTDALVRAAVDAPPLTEESLEKLAPLLERYHDGETTPAETRSVEQLRRERTDVDDYLDGLEFLGASIRAAEREATGAVDTDAIWDGVAREIDAEPDLSERTDYDPERHQELLHRYADGELDGDLRAQVEAWLETDDEARATLEAIEEIGEAARAAEREAAADVDLDRIWDGVAREIDADEPERAIPPYQPERDQELLHRYADGELDDEQRAKVEAWLEADEEARVTLEAIGEIGEATRLAEREARYDVDLDDIWNGIEDRIEPTDEGSGRDDGEVVSLDAARREADRTSETESVSDSSETDASGGVIEWMSKYRQAVGGAAAAAVVLIAAVALFGPRLFEKERVVVKEKKTVVIVDSVQYSSGSTVAVDGPMKKVSSKSDAGTASKKQDKPTVIWLLDSNGDQQSSDDEGASSESGASSGDEGTPSDEDAGRTDDAGDAKSGKPGQPI